MSIFYNPDYKYMQNGKSYVTAGKKANTTLGSNATAEGLDTTASGNYSHAQGLNTIASGQASTALGTNTTASRTNQVVLGEYNVTDNDAIVIIGGGTEANPRNLLTVDAATGNVSTWGGKSLIAAPPTNNGTYLYKFLNGVGSWVSVTDAGICTWGSLPE